MAVYHGTLTVKVDGKEHEIAEGGSLLELSKECRDDYDADIVIATVDYKLRELSKSILKESDISFITTAMRDGKKVYRRSLIFLMQKAFDNLVRSGKYGTDDNDGAARNADENGDPGGTGETARSADENGHAGGAGEATRSADGKDKALPDIRVMYSLGNGYYCVLYSGKEDGEGPAEVTEDFLSMLSEEMSALVERDLKINKRPIYTREAESVFGRHGMKTKQKLLHYRSSSYTNIYELDGTYDYLYGYMVPSTGYLKYFRLEKFEDGFMLLFPTKDPKKVEEFHPYMKLFNIMQVSTDWSEKLNIRSVGSLNDAIVHGKTRDIILMQEGIMEEYIGRLAHQIASGDDRHFIMIAGPSSSGKTTFSHRLSVQLGALGLKPHPFPLDDYYNDHDKMPIDEYGKVDFEALECLDIELFNNDMQKLLRGETAELPTFNFKTGKREYKGRTMKLEKGDILVIEGIHGLNDRLSYSLPKESKYKIYISALTQLSIDEHNPLSTTDGRLIRRIVRDARTRGTSAKDTIAMWESVHRGEEKNIFPFQDSADAFFNSALIYEMAVIKLYAMPELYSVPRDCPEYPEAKRLLKLLDYFLPIPPDDIARNSLIREFIGGSCFDV